MNDSSLTRVSDWLRQSVASLKDAGISTARLDCLVLLEDETGQDRAWLLAHPEYVLQGSDLKKLNTKITQRVQHVPLAYLRGKAEFYGHEFIVNAHTLVPRPETEGIIELLRTVCNRESSVISWQDQSHRREKGRGSKSISTPTAKQSSLVHTDAGYKVVWEKHPGDKRRPSSAAVARSTHLRDNDASLKLVDIGTGSGAIAITAKLEHPNAIVTATDIDENCLATARDNAQRLNADIEFLHGNLLEPLTTGPKDQILILLCNLPYVPDNFQINTAATHEPRHALFGGPDGLDLYRELFAQIKAQSHQPDYILTESLPPQHATLAGIAQSAAYKLTQTSDFIQLFMPAH
jgi:methylase of polypeptide subunit release factors